MPKPSSKTTEMAAIYVEDQLIRAKKHRKEMQTRLELEDMRRNIR